jgi:hypothetical protein
MEQESLRHLAILEKEDEELQVSFDERKYDILESFYEYLQDEEGGK